MKVFITGTSGYLGSLLVPFLRKRGIDVIGFDTGYFSDRSFYGEHPSGYPLIVKDLRKIEKTDLQDCDAVVHMAEISNDPAGELSPNITDEINHKGTVRLAEIAKESGIKRFVHMSSCSVYGVAASGWVDEETRVNPQTAYAHCKTRVERDLQMMADDGFSPTFHRNGTAFGSSPYMRFDLVVNNLAGLAWTTNEIAMTSDGTPWRPLVHVLDICRAISCVLEASRETIHNQVLNVGSSENNYQVREVAEIIAEVFPGCKLSFGAPGPDNRSYRVRFDKIHNLLPDFHCEWDVRKGAEQLRQVFERISMEKETFDYRGFTRLKQLRYLLQENEIDGDFFWTSMSSSA